MLDVIQGHIVNGITIQIVRSQRQHHNIGLTGEIICGRLILGITQLGIDFLHGIRCPTHRCTNAGYRNQREVGAQVIVGGHICVSLHGVGNQRIARACHTAFPQVALSNRDRVADEFDIQIIVLGSIQQRTTQRHAVNARRDTTDRILSIDFKTMLARRQVGGDFDLLRAVFGKVTSRSALINAVNDHGEIATVSFVNVLNLERYVCVALAIGIKLKAGGTPIQIQARISFINTTLSFVMPRHIGQRKIGAVDSGGFDGNITSSTQRTRRRRNGSRTGFYGSNPTADDRRHAVIGGSPNDRLTRRSFRRKGRLQRDFVADLQFSRGLIQFDAGCRS